MQLGMIGLGRMGANMAQRLRDAGHDVVGYDRDPAVSDTADLPALKAYLRALYDAKFAGAPSPFHPDREAVAAYDYARIARQIAALL